MHGLQFWPLVCVQFPNIYSVYLFIASIPTFVHFDEDKT